MVTPPQLHMACDLLECQPVCASRGAGLGWEGWEGYNQEAAGPGSGQAQNDLASSFYL